MELSELAYYCDNNCDLPDEPPIELSLLENN
jgi:hypothetical protein